MPYPPIEPPPSRFLFPDPLRCDEDDVIAVGGDLEPGTLVQAYRRGLFPMHIRPGLLGWWSPSKRGIIRLGDLRMTRSLRRSCRRYRTTFDGAFDRVIANCSDPARPHGWITSEMTEAYSMLHRLGWAHSVETWDESGELVGGLYGVAVGGVFSGESMFHHRSDASKVALAALESHLRERGGVVIDVQWVTDHLASLGAVEVSRLGFQEFLDEGSRRPPIEFPSGRTRRDPPG
jgi:leucyl/phenylalanyl-tRNA--protein transferase